MEYTKFDGTGHSTDLRATGITRRDFTPERKTSEQLASVGAGTSITLSPAQVTEISGLIRQLQQAQTEVQTEVQNLVQEHFQSLHEQLQKLSDDFRNMTGRHATNSSRHFGPKC